MSFNHRVVVLGGGYAGMMCAQRLARRTRWRGGVYITLVNPSPRFTERLRLHQLAAGHELGDYPIARLLEDTGIEFLCGKAAAIDTVAREVTVETLGTVRRLDYDTLVYAVGSSTETRTVPGAEEHAYTLNTAQQALRVARGLRELAATGGTVTVCGGGLTGVETAAEIAESHPGLRVSLISRGEPAAVLGARARAHMTEVFERLGVTVRRGTVTKVLPDAVELAGGETVTSDLTVWTTGVRVPGLAARAGIGTAADGLIAVDPTLRSLTHPDIYAVGDAAHIRQRWGALHGTCQSAMPSGAHAADQIARQLEGGIPKPFRFGYFHQPVSLGRGDAVVQFVRHDDSPRRLLITGRRAVRYKESISAGPISTYTKTKGLLGLLVPTGISKGGFVTRRPYQD
ncbi:FAD-dependent oxidoreductase [Nocardia sp. 2]|uniref:FAD-dependent oxidoreductase n=1 Tax=Nocardia acididurans TaxID=2802282 RepID=A0ABS1M5H1_9NOCA|nr:FAD-dependent oxidoreductase [Nocardia acididurans]MBL1075454.1 FAD-dependent oxidoreductase [Nocardia acididurans]